MIIYSLFILQAISASYCYDLQLEGVVKIDNSLLKKFRKQAEFANKLNIPLNFANKGKLPMNALDSMGMRAVSDPNMIPTDKTEKNIPENLKYFLRHLQETGKMTLQNMGLEILTELEMNNNITAIVNAVTNDYVTLMQNYYEFVTANKTDSIIERDLAYLDIVETSNRLLYTEQRKLLNDIIGQNLTALDEKVKKINEQISKQSVNDKKVKLKYVCDKYQVCREYPAFTDYCADVISEILKLSDKKFSKLLEVLTKIIKDNEIFFAGISEKEDRELIMAKLETFSVDLFDMKEFFAVLRAVITQRFKVVSSNNDNLKIKTKATRILMDIINKGLSSEDDLIAIDFDNAVSVMRNWAVDARGQIDDIYVDFTKNLFRVLEHNLTKRARKEISVLIKTIMRGNNENDKVYQELFNYGSKYVKGEDLHTVIDSFY